MMRDQTASRVLRCPYQPSQIHQGRFYVKHWPRLVIHVFGDEVTYLDLWGLGQCQRGTFAKWADRLMTTDDEITFEDDLKRIKDLQGNMTAGTEPAKIRLIIENDPTQLTAKHSRVDDDRRRDHAARTLRTLAINLLRVIAGAGEPNRLPRDLRDAFTAWAEFAEADHNHMAETPGAGDLTVDHLFSDNEQEPQTQAEWKRWAEDDPQRDYLKQRDWAMLELRRSILREIAATIDGSRVQISRRESDVQSALYRLERVRDEYFGKPKARPVAAPAIGDLGQQRKVDQPIAYVRTAKPKPDPSRQTKAEEEIAKLREAERDKMIANLAAHQWAALRAVRSGNPLDFESTDAFTFEVLGGKKLLKRKQGGGKSKRDWELTELGVLALSRDPVAK